MASLINKAKDKIEQTLNQNKGDNPRSSNAGPHSSNFMNKTDPTVDSDRDHRNDPTSRVGGVGSTQEYNTIHDQTTAPGYAGGAGVGSVEPGYGQTGAGLGHTGPTGHHTTHAGGIGGTTAGGLGSTHNTYDNPQSTNAGPHRSNLANKLDPRADSDRDNRNDPTSRVGGYGTQTDTYGHSAGVPGTHGTHGTHTGVPGTHGTHGGIGTHETHGTHTNVGTHGTHGGVGTTGGYGPGATTGTVGGQGYNNTPGSGNAQNTAGPHNSDLLNKLDPRVDADLDGSKTYGGNATYR